MQHELFILLVARGVCLQMPSNDYIDLFQIKLSIFCVISRTAIHYAYKKSKKKVQ